MNNPRAWSLLAVDGERQYGGNNGYQDAPSRTYRYDSLVANHQQVSKRDLAVVRSSSQVLGIAQITDIKIGRGEKVRLRCPRCDTSDLKRRTTMSPAWVCRNRHEFDDPRSEVELVNTYTAEYGATFRPTPKELTPERLAAAVMRPNDQMSIKEIDLAKIEEWLRDDPGCRKLVVTFGNAITVDSVNATKTDLLPQSIIEARRRVLREISLRRGQQNFRNRLIARYGAACQISLCGLPDLIEAAHIRPYAETNDNGAHNGLLLRSDLHTLFDLHLVAINPKDSRVRLHPSLLTAGYANFEDAPLFVNGTTGPDPAALLDRWELFMAAR